MTRNVHNRLKADKVLICLIRHPYRHIFRRWNWKSAFLSAVVRGILVLLVNLSSGGASAAGAMSAEICYRALTSGFYSSIVQAFRYVQPAWAATLVAMVLLPSVCDTVEFGVHFLRGTERIGETIVASAIFTVAATLMELFAMRHGVLVVGRNSHSLLQDLKTIPRLTSAFFDDCLHFLSAAWSLAGFKSYPERRTIKPRPGPTVDSPAEIG